MSLRTSVDKQEININIKLLLRTPSFVSVRSGSEYRSLLGTFLTFHCIRTTIIEPFRPYPCAIKNQQGAIKKTRWVFGYPSLFFIRLLAIVPTDKISVYVCSLRYCWSTTIRPWSSSYWPGVRVEEQGKRGQHPPHQLFPHWIELLFYYRQ